MPPTQENINKETLDVLLSSQAKSTEQMVMVATYLKDIAENQKKIVDKLNNGLKDDIVKKVSEEFNNSPVAKDIEHTKWFIGIVGIVIIAATVILNGLEKVQSDNDYKRDTRQIVELLQKHDSRNAPLEHSN